MSKHKTIAILIAPFLALGGYILADIYDNNELDKADKKLFVSNQCKPVEGQCEILGIGMEMRLVFKAKPNSQASLPIELISKTSLDDVAMSLIINDEENAPMKMQDTGDKKRWVIDITPNATITNSNSKARLAVSYKASLHFVEFPIYYQ